MIRCWWLFCLASLGCASLKHHAPLVPSGNSVPVKLITYPTGLRVFAEQHTGSKRVGIALLVGAGAADDVPGKEGTAHFIEHLAFRSRPSNRLQMWDELDFAGVASIGAPMANARTSLDSTLYSGMVASDRWREVFPLLAALVVRPLSGIDLPTLEVERSVVRNEYLERNPHGGGAYLAKLGEVVFGSSSRPARPISGDPKSLASIGPADLEQFVKTYYRPETVTVVLVGDFDLESIDATVRQAFPAAWLDAPTRTEPFKRVVLPTTTPDAQLDRPLLEIGVTKRVLVFAWQVPGPDSLAHLAMPQVARELAGRLAHELRRNTFSVRGEYLPGLFGSMLTVSISVANDEDIEALSKRVRALKNLFWKLSAREEQERGFQRFTEQQNLLLHAESRALELWMSLRGVNSVTLTQAGWDEVNRIHEEVLVWANARELLLVPRVQATENAPLPPVPNALQKNVVVEPERLAAVALPAALPNATSSTLPNGLRVVLSKRLPVPVVSVTLALPVGSRHTTKVSAVLVKSTIDWNQHKRADFFSLGTPTVEVGSDVTTINLTRQAWQLPVMLDVIAHNLSPHVSWDRVWTAETIFASMREYGRRASRDAEEDERTQPLRALVLPPGNAELPLTLDETKDVNRADVVRFVDAAFRAKGAVLFIDGDFDVVSTKLLVDELFAGWDAGDGKQPPLRKPAAMPAKPRDVRVIDEQDAIQTTVTLMCRLPPAKTLHERGGMALLADALALSFGDDLRRERGLTYGVDTDVTESSNDENLLTLSTTLDARNRQQGLKQFFARLDSLDGAVWEEGVVDLARWRLAKRHLSSHLTSKNVSLVLSREMARGDSLEEAAAMPRRLATVPLKFVDDAWNACTDSLAIEVRGQRSTIDMVLRARAKK